MSASATDFIDLASAIADSNPKINSKAKPYLITAAIVAAVGGLAYASYRFGARVAERREQAETAISR